MIVEIRLNKSQKRDKSRKSLKPSWPLCSKEKIQPLLNYSPLIQKIRCMNVCVKGLSKMRQIDGEPYMPYGLKNSISLLRKIIQYSRGSLGVLNNHPSFFSPRITADIPFFFIFTFTGKCSKKKKKEKNYS